MTRTDDDKAILDRIERVRRDVGHSKTRFAAAIGLSPQTYNNFTGAQGSKPSVALVRGVIREFRVNPYWLLFGEGGPRIDADPSAITLSTTKTDLQRLLVPLQYHVESLQKLVNGP